MLKACCDCIFGEHLNTEGSYGMNMNGDILNAPLWPPNNMMLVPSELNLNHKLNISGTLVPGNVLTVSLLSNEKLDPQNIPCLLEINPESNPNEILLKSIQNGSQLNILQGVYLTEAYITSSNFCISLSKNRYGALDIFINNEILDEVKIDPSEIRYIKIEGDSAKVNELSFQFAQT